jgi:hypothetical protein
MHQQSKQSDSFQTKARRGGASPEIVCYENFRAHFLQKLSGPRLALALPVDSQEAPIRLRNGPDGS